MYIIEIVAMIIIVLGCTYFGIYFGENFKRRNTQLNQFLKAILILNNEVIYAQSPIPQALSSISSKFNDAIGKLLEGISNRLIDEKNDSVYEAYLDEYNALKDKFFLKEDDERVIEDFFKSLGETAMYGQDKIFKLTIDNLKRNCEVAKEMEVKNVKMYRALGVSIGIMIVIVLM